MARSSVSDSTIYNQLILGIDPSTGSSSPVGIALFNAETKDIIFYTNILTKKKQLHHRIRDISQQLAAILAEIPNPYTIVIERFVMRGVGGESLQRVIGAYMALIPYECELTFVQNTTAKKVMAGHGHAEKIDVALGVLNWFKGNEASYNIIKELTNKKEFDILDAFALGVTAWKTKK